MERYRRAALTAVASAAAKGFAVLANLIVVPLTVTYLGMERYGLWMTISSVIAMLVFADLGMGNGLMNAVSEANGKEDREAAHEYVSSAFFMLFGVGVTLPVCFALLYPRISWLRVFNISSPQAVGEAGPATAVFFACFVLNIPLGVVERVRMGYQEGFTNSLWSGFGSLLGLAGVLLVIHLEAGLPWLVLAMAGAPVLANLLNGAVLFGFQKPWLRPNWSSATAPAAKKILTVGILFFVLQAAGAVVFASDNIVAAQVLGPKAVTQYSVPMRLFNITPLVLAMLMTPLWPAYGEAIARGDTAWVKRTLARSILVSLLVIVATSAFLVLFGRPIIHLWVGPQIAPTLLLLLGLGVWAVLNAVGYAVAMFWNGANVVGFQVVFAVLIAVSAIIAKIFLARTIGLPGVIWGTVIAYSVFALIPTIIYLPRVLARLQQGEKGLTELSHS